MIPAITIVCGAILIAIGVVGYVASDTGSVTALIPAFLGVPLIILGLVARAKPDWRRHAMHAAAALTLLGFLAAAGRYASSPGNPFAQLGSATLLSMAIVCLLLLIFYIRSFIEARRQREAGREPT